MVRSKVEWFSKRKDLLFDGFESIARLRSGVPYEELPNVEPDGDGSSYYVYLKGKHSGFRKACRVRLYSAVVLFGVLQSFNALFLLYFMLNTYVFDVIWCLLIGNFVLIFTMIVIGSVKECVKVEGVSCNTSLSVSR